MSEANPSVSDRVLIALRRAKTRIAELEAKGREPIAIIGMACRFPGGPTPESFWTTLVERKDMVREIPDERLIGPWPADVPRWAGLLDDVAGFDPGFFGISPFEALSIDPQQRMLLEVAWEALERAMLVPAKLRASKTGVFVGLTGAEYQQRTQLRPDAERSAYDVTGIMLSAASGRIAYVLGLQGPALTVDTACSSSLVAIHLACQSLRAGDSNLALAGGAKLIASEHYLDALSYTQGLSPDGRCRAFDASANGFVLGEGCGMLVLKRLSDAQRDGDPILGVVRASGINQDGRSTGLTAPNVLAQEALLRSVLVNAGLEPHEIEYIECHGTGTPLGDPIEIEAIKSVYGAPRADGSPVWLGSVKTNIGHLEAASGVAGVVKILLALEHRQIPANIHLRHVNPRIKLSGTPLKILTAPVEWSSPNGRATVSSFGMSGTNAHVVVERAPAPPALAARARARLNHPPILLSAHSQAALPAQAAQLRDFLATHGDLPGVDVAFSLATTRTQFEHRACIVADDLAAALDDLARKGRLSSAILGQAKPNPKLGLLFTGQGAQRAAMARALDDAFPVFHAALTEIAQVCDAWLAEPLRSVLFADPGSAKAALLDQTAFTQPALFAVEVALVRLLNAWGIQPDVLLGHSIGELAAAHVAGVFSLADAAKLVCARGRLMQALPAGGAMMSIQASEQEILPLLAQQRGVDVAGFNGPQATVVSGDEEPTLAIARHFEALGRKTSRLTVSHAFHSHHMDAMLADFRRVAESIEYRAPTIPVVSNSTGALATADDLCSPDYWVQHVRAPVRFVDGVRALQSFGASVLLEVGPHGVLTSMASTCLSESARRTTTLVAALRRDKPEVDTLSSALGALHCSGVDVDWPAVFADDAPVRVALPTYAFQRERFWLAASRRTPARVHQLGILGERVSSPLPSAQFRAVLQAADLPLHTDQQPQAVHPAYLLSMIRAAAQQVFGLSVAARISATLDSPLVLADAIEATLHLIVEPPAAERASFALHAQSSDEPGRWRTILRGEVEASVPSPSSSAGSVSTPMGAPIEATPCSSAPTSAIWFTAQRVAASPDRFAVRLQPTPPDLDRMSLHPAILDAAIQLGLSVAGEDGPRVDYELVGWDHLVILADVPATYQLGIRSIATDEAGLACWDLDFHDERGRLLAQFSRLVARSRGPMKEIASSTPIEDLEGRLLEITRHTLGFTPDPEDDFASIHGVDSLSLMSFMNAIQKEYGVSLQRIYGARASFSIRALIAILGGETLAADLGSVSFTIPDGPIVVRETTPEALPASYGLTRTPRTWLCSLADTYELEIIEFGEGPPVVFLPPFNSEWVIWLPIIQRLVPNHRVIAVNYPGLGRSRGADGFQDAPRLAAWICWALDALGISGFTLIGWSLGGFLTQQIAAVRPDLVSRLVLVNTTAKLEGADTAAGTEYLIRTLESDLDAHLLTVANLEQRKLLRDLVYHRHDARDIELSYYSIIATWDFREEVASITQPALIVTGGTDELTLPRYGEYMHQSIVGSKLAILETGHYLPLFATDDFCNLLIEFLGS